MTGDLSVTQKRALAIVTVIAVVFGAYFLKRYLILIIVAAITAYLFAPMYRRFTARMGTALAATATVLIALLAVIVPVALLVLLAVVQTSQLIAYVSVWVAKTDLGALGNRTLDYVNELLARVPFLDMNLNPDTLRSTMSKAAQAVGEWALHLVQGSLGGIFAMVTAAVIFLYVFISLMVKGEQVRELIRQLNPLGEEITDLYLAKMGAMVKATVKGQFVIALAQGIAGAISIYIAGLHDGFFVFAIFLSALSVIPLGSGIVTIPLGIGMILFGNVFGGVFVIVFHLVITTNIDNVLRPILVPRQARLDQALMLLAVFSGLAMFGFAGIVIGPVLMIVIVTTISVYLEVYKGVEMDVGEQDNDSDRPPMWRRLWRMPRELWATWRDRPDSEVSATASVTAD
ncbi:MAG: AI-2E family transporter [Mycobacterium sp.]